MVNLDVKVYIVLLCCGIIFLFGFDVYLDCVIDVSNDNGNVNFNSNANGVLIYGLMVFCGINIYCVLICGFY